MIAVPQKSATPLVVIFASAGHLLMHMLTALYVTVVLLIEKAWAMPFDDLIRLWTVGSLMIGLGAPAAGWLADRWSESRMMALFFLITGSGSIYAGLSDGTLGLWIGLTTLGLGASIFHPVGMAWVVKHAVNRGKALGVMGIFGSVGIAAAPVVAGALDAAFDWRAAFLIPGIICVAMGGALIACIATGLMHDLKEDAKPQPRAGKDDMIRTFLVLSLTMFALGLMFNSVQTIMPKWFELSMADLVDGSILGVTAMVTMVYLIGSTSQLAGGWLADKYDPKRVYCVTMLLQAPLILLASMLFNVPLLIAATAMVFMTSMQIPAENVLLARYTPARHRGLAFGAKFILSFGAGPVAIQLAAFSFEETGAFTALLLGLAALLGAAFLASLLLPGDKTTAAPAPAAAPAPGE